MQIISYDPPIEEHPAYAPTPEFEVGDVVETPYYSGSRLVRDSNGEVIGSEKFLNEDFQDGGDGEGVSDSSTTPLVQNNFIVREIDGVRVQVQFGLNGSTRWIPRDMVVGVDNEKKAEFQERAEARRKAKERRKEREGQDLEFIMEEIIKPHARKVVSEVWPGGTVDVDEISWFWNHHLRSCAGRAYYRGAEPSERYDVSSPAIGLSPHYYHTHGIDEMLEVVRHELIHVWQFKHPEAKSGHGPKFKQWLDDMDTERYCKHYSR